MECVEAVGRRLVFGAVGLPFDPIAEAERQWTAHWVDGAPLAPMAAVTSVMRAHQMLLARLNELLEPWGSRSRATRR